MLSCDLTLQPLPLELATISSSYANHAPITAIIECLPPTSLQSLIDRHFNWLDVQIQADVKNQLDVSRKSILQAISSNDRSTSVMIPMNALSPGEDVLELTNDTATKRRRQKRAMRITDVKLHSRLHIYNFVGYDVSLPDYFSDAYEREPADAGSKWKKYGRITHAAAVFGDLEAIEYLCNEIDDNPLTPLRIADDERRSKKLAEVCWILGKTQHWKGLKWVVENGFSVDGHTIGGAILGGADLELLQWLQSHKCIVDEGTFCNAAERGDLEIMQWLWSIHCPWAEDTFLDALKNGNMDNLVWLKSKGCPWNEEVFENAALLGNRDILLWLRLEGCPWNSQTFSNAVESGTALLTLKWMCHEKCPWNEGTFHAAVGRGNLNILKWLREKRCPWDSYCYNIAIEKRNGKVLKWLRDQGCPLNDDAIDLFVDSIKSRFDNDNTN